jgi:hypothetical protein
VPEYLLAILRHSVAYMPCRAERYKPITADLIRTETITMEEDKGNTLIKVRIVVLVLN